MIDRNSASTKYRNILSAKIQNNVQLSAENWDGSMMYIPSADIHLSGQILLPTMQKICTYILYFETDINWLVVIKKYAETSIAAEILLPLRIAENKNCAESFTFH